MRRIFKGSNKVKNNYGNTLSIYNISAYIYKFWKDFGVPIAFVLIIIIFSIATPKFMTYENITNLIRQRSILAIAAVGTTIIMIGGGIDLSVGAVVGFATCMVIMPMAYWGWPAPIAIIMTLAIGLLIGLINGLLVNKLMIPPLIVTLGMMLIVRGTAYVLTNNRTITGNIPDWYYFIGRGWIGPIPFQIILITVIYVFMGFLLKWETFGLHTYALGSSRKSARLAGINVSKHSILLYMIGGLTSAAAGILLSSRLGSGWASHGEGYEFDIIAAVLLGGTSIFGGRGNIFRSLLGIMLIGGLINGMNLLNVSSFYQMITTGFVLLFAIALERLKSEDKNNT